MTAVIDLFAGAGGLSLGAREAEADVRLLVEWDGDACLTLKRNGDIHGGEVLCGDVRELSADEMRERAAVAGEPLLIVGGAPCQPFSKAAYWVEAGEEAAYRRARAQGLDVVRPPAPVVVRPDGRRSLVDEFVRIVLGADADGFVFENVPSILHPRNRPVVDNLCAVAGEAGYHTTLVRASGAAHGVPQNRVRVFVLGSRHAVPSAPRPTHALSTEAAEGSDLLPPATAGPALAPFGHPDFYEDGEVVTGRWADHLTEIPPGWNYKWHTEWAGHEDPTFVTETRFWNFLLKLSPDLPSWTIAASPGPWTGPFHWNSRRLRSVEMAALQGFPAGYEFEGTRRERIRQIGNAVPPMLAAPMVRAVIDTFG